MYDDYQRHKDLYNSVELFPVQPYRQSRLMQQQKQRKQQGQQNQQRKKKPVKRGNKQYNSQMKRQFNEFNNRGKMVHSGSSGLLKNMESLVVPILLIAAAAMGLKKFLGNLNVKDMAANAYGGDEVSPSGRSTGHVSQKGLNLIKNQEGGFHPEAYLVKGEKYYTIGYGDHGPHVHAGDKITEAEATQRLMKKVHACEQDVNNRIKVPLSQNMFDALVSLAYNMGSLAPAETLVKKLNAGDYVGAAEAFKLYNKGKEGGKVVEYAGLTKRRQLESDLFKSDIDVGANKLKSTAKEINPVQDLSVKEVDMGSITKAKQIGGNGIHYDEGSNITSHTKLSTGTNDKYDVKNGKMGSFDGYTITSGIGKRSVSGGSSFHRGLDLAFAKGTPVKAFCSGTVTHCGPMAGFGRCIIINDKNGYRHVYGHLLSYKVSYKQKVKKGQIIALSGGSYSPDGKKIIDDHFAYHLHYGIWKPGGTSDKKDYIDPRTYKYPPEDGEIPKTETPKQETPKGNPITPTTQKPTTQNPSTQKQTQIKQASVTPKGGQIHTNINQQKPNKGNGNVIPIDQPNIKNRSIPQSKKK